MPLVGIPLETLYTLMIMPATILLLFICILWFAYFPKSAKTIILAKVFKQDVSIKASTVGNLVFRRGKAEGPGVFRYGKLGLVDFIMRGKESWENKAYTCDKIRFLFGVEDKAILTNPKVLLVMNVHQKLLEEKKLLDAQFEREKSKEENSEKTVAEIYEDWIKANPRYRKLLEELKQARINVDHAKAEAKEAGQEVTGQDEADQEQEQGQGQGRGGVGKGKSKSKKQRIMERTSAFLVEFSVLSRYFTNMVLPSQVKHVANVAYEKGVEETKNPASKYKGLLIVFLIVGIIIALIVGLFLMGGGGTASKVAATPRP